MAGELSGMLAGNVSSVTGENVKPTYGDSFLDKVVTPIYEVIAEVSYQTLLSELLSVCFPITKSMI